jgi:hypothetical protein
MPPMKLWFGFIGDIRAPILFLLRLPREARFRGAV